MCSVVDEFKDYGMLENLSKSLFQITYLFCFQVGAVNFNILHTLLNTILEKLNLQDVLTELPTSKW